MTRSGSRAHILGAAHSAFLLATGVASRGLAAVDSAPVPLGDVNDDGEVSIVVALLLAQHNNGTDTGREYYLVNADLTAERSRPARSAPAE